MVDCCFGGRLVSCIFLNEFMSYVRTGGSNKFFKKINEPE